MGSELFSQVDGPEVDLTYPSQDCGRVAKGPFEELDGITIYVEEDSRVADQWLAELETNAAAIAELVEPGSGPSTSCGPEREGDGSEDPRSSRLLIYLVYHEASFDAPSLKR